MEHPSTDQIMARNWWWIPVLCLGQWPILFCFSWIPHPCGNTNPILFCELLVSNVLSVSRECAERRVSSGWCYTCAPREGQMQFKSCLQIVYGDRTVEVPRGSQIMVCCVPSGLKATCNWDAVEIRTEPNTLVESMPAEYLPLAKWMESVISITLGLHRWGHSIQVVVIHREASFILSKLKNRPNWAVKWRNRGDNHPFSK